MLFFLKDTVTELWFLDKSSGSWKLGKFTEIRTIYNHLLRLLI